MQYEIKEVAKRLKGLREILGISTVDMAELIEITEQEYLVYENGESDFSFTFLYKCAKKFEISIAELISGETPKLSHYEVVRKNSGFPITRRKGFSYQHLAILMKNKTAEPFKIVAPFVTGEEEIHLNTHKGQEFNYILKGSLKFQIGEHIEILNEGDSIYYNSSEPHGMIATNGEACEFLAIVMMENGGM
jgi:transcriptional regulator with XRE-family HTH domain